MLESGEEMVSVQIRDGYVMNPDRPGSELEWHEGGSGDALVGSAGLLNFQRDLRITQAHEQPAKADGSRPVNVRSRCQTPGAATRRAHAL